MPVRVQLVLTQRCNAKCSYCMVNRENSDSNLTKEQLAEILKDVDLDNLVMFGGEPLLRKDLADELSSDYKGKRILPSNGLLLTDEIIDEYGKVLLSTNGTKETCEMTGQQFNPNIPLINNKEKITIGLRVIPKTAHRLKLDFDYLYNAGYRKFNIGPILEMDDWDDETIGQYFEGVQYILTQIDDVKQVWNWKFGRVCVPFKSMMCIDQDGKKWPCARYMSDKIDIPENIPDRAFHKCYKCEYMPYCFHNCTYLNYVNNGSLSTPFNRACEFAKNYKRVIELAQATKVNSVAGHTWSNDNISNPQVQPEL